MNMNAGNKNVFINFLEKHKLIFWISSFIVILFVFGIFNTHIKCNASTIKPFKYSIKNISIEQLKDFELYDAVLLKDGNVLFLGGKNIKDNIVADKAYVYDPQKNIIIKEARMNNPRYASYSSLLSNGNILIVGGYNYNKKNNQTYRVKSIEIYDTIKNEFQVVTTFNPFLGLTYIIETSNPNEILLYSNLANILILNVKHRIISDLNTIEYKEGSKYYSSIKVKDNLFFFPYKFSKTHKNLVYKLNLKTYKLKQINIVNLTQKSLHFVQKPVNIKDSDILFFGVTDDYIPSSDIVSYNIDANTLNIKAQLITPRRMCGTLPLNENNILIFDGSQGINESTKKVKTCEIYNIKEQKIIAKNNNNIDFSNQYNYLKIQDKKFLVFDKGKIKLLEFK